MKASGEIVPKVVLPEDAGKWTSVLDWDELEVASLARTKDDPARVVLSRKSGDPVMHVTAEKLRDGLHFYVKPRPGLRASPPLHLALRNKPTREAKMSATAGILTGVAVFAAEHPQAVWGAVHDWMKKVHVQVLRCLEQQGLQALREVTPGFLGFARECMRLVDRAMNRDVDDALERVRAEFQFLADHVDEEDVLRLWRELIVEKTHDH